MGQHKHLNDVWKFSWLKKMRYSSPVSFNPAWIAKLKQRHEFDNINVIFEGKQSTYFERPEMEA